MNDIEDPIVYPENPPWTMFFDGPLYEKYKDFMMTKDFSQILLKNKLKIAHQSSTVPEVPDAVEGIDWWSVDQDVTGKSEKQFASDTYNSVSDDFYRKFTRGKKEEKRRTRRTRAIILLIILVLLGVSLGTALIIHYFFVPTDENQVPAQVNISFSGNTSIFGMTTDNMKVDEDLSDKTSSIHDLLNTFEADKTMAVPDKPRKEDLGPVLLKTVQPPLVDTVRVSSTSASTSNSSSTTSSTSASTSPSRKQTVNTEPATPGRPIDTGTFNAMDFFGMDDSFTTSELPITVPVTTVKVFKTNTPIKPTLSTETLSLTATEAAKTTTVASTKTVTSVIQETTTAAGTPKPPETTSSLSTATATKVQDITESFTTNKPTTDPVQEAMSSPQHSMTNSTTMTMTPTQSELPATTSTMPSNTTTSTPATPMMTTTTAVPPVQTIPETSTAATTTQTITTTTQPRTKMTSQATTTQGTTTQAATTTTSTQATTTTIPETTTEVMPRK